MAIVPMEMSEATQYFTRELLSAEDIVFKTALVCAGVNEITFQDRTGPDRTCIWGEEEDKMDGQPGCKQSMLERELSPLSFDGRTLCTFDVPRLALPRVHEGK